MTPFIITNPKKTTKNLYYFKKDGWNKLFVISDFDGTLTKVFYRGKARPSIISILRDENYLSADYSKKAKELYEKYHPFADDQKIPLKRRKKLMEKWWREHYRLLIKSGLKKQHIKKIINSNILKLREGYKKFFDFFAQNNIPFVIFSSGGLGGDVIKLFLKKNGINYKNIIIVSNFLKWNKKGKMTGFYEPVVASLNKEGFLLKKIPALWRKIKNRNNLIVLGNDISDLTVINGLKIKNLLKIGFLNEEIEKNLKEYKKHFDVLILNDGDLHQVNQLLKILSRF
jgi:5'-nucleotidase